MIFAETSLIYKVSSDFRTLSILSPNEYDISIKLEFWLVYFKVRINPKIEIILFFDLAMTKI